MSGAIVLRGICFALLLVSIFSSPNASNVTSQDKLEPFITESSSFETPLPSFSFHEIRYEQIISDSSFVETEDSSGVCTLQIFCRPTGAVNPSLHCYIITNDNRQQAPVSAKFTAGPDPKRRNNIASWRIEPVKEPINDVPCIQCLETNRIPCFKIDCLRSLTKEFNDSRFEYDFRARKGPNSNSFVTGILKRCGLSYSTVHFAAGANGYEYVFN